MGTEFKGNPLIKPLICNFLTGNFGKEILEEYNSIVRSKYENNRSLEVLHFDTFDRYLEILSFSHPSYSEDRDFHRNINLEEGVVTGSNTYSNILMNEIALKYGLRAINPSDLQKIMDIDGKILKKSYEDLGVVLRNESGSYKYLAEQLGKQAKDRKYEFSDSNPLVFRPSDLELISDRNSISGLGFKITDSARPFNAPQFDREKYEVENYEKTNENGIPIFNKKGKMTNYNEKTYPDGLFRLVMYFGKRLHSDDPDLGDSQTFPPTGRIILIKDAD